MDEQQIVAIDPETRRAMMRRRATQIKCFASCVIPVGIADFATHTGLGGLILGGAAAAALSAAYPDFKEDFGDMLAPVKEILAPLNAPIGGRSILDRAIGRYPAQVEEGEIEVEPLTEDEMLQAQEIDVEFRQEMQPLPTIFPVYPDNDTLRLGKSINRESSAALSAAYIESLQTGKRVEVVVPGHRFDPHFNGLFGKGIIAAANQGFGKSILNGVVIEQAGKAGVPAIVLDHKGEYNTVKELPSVNVLLVGAPDSGSDFILRAKEVDSSGKVLDPGNADEFVALVMQKRYQAVINLSSYGSKWVSRARIVGAVGKALMDYAEAKRHAGGQLLPCLVLLDEAQLYIPQNKELLPPEAQENKAVLSELSNAYFALVSNGRSNGYTLCFATQSLTYIAKWAIKSSQIRVLGRHSEKNDLDMCGDIISAEVATRAEIESFAPGVFVVFGFTPQPMIVQFDKKQSRDLSETPGIDRLREPQQQSVPSRQPVQRLPDLATLLEEDDAPITFEELCDAVFEMAMARDSDSAIMRQLDLTREEYVNIATYIKTHRSEFMGSAPASVSTSQAGSVAASTSTSHPTSRQNERLRLVDAQEVCREVERSGEEVKKPLEVGTPMIPELSERELRMATMFFDQNLGINVIMKEFFPGVTGGTPYQKGNAEIGDALRKYTQMQKRA